MTLHTAKNCFLLQPSWCSCGANFCLKIDRVQGLRVRLHDPTFTV